MDWAYKSALLFFSEFFGLCGCPRWIKKCSFVFWATDGVDRRPTNSPNRGNPIVLLGYRSDIGLIQFLPFN